MGHDLMLEMPEKRSNPSVQVWITWRSRRSRLRNSSSGQAGSIPAEFHIRSSATRAVSARCSISLIQTGYSLSSSSSIPRRSPPHTHPNEVPLVWVDDGGMIEHWAEARKVLRDLDAERRPRRPSWLSRIVAPH
jgi:hypothetical protein